MFTGIVQATGVVRSVQRGPSGTSLVVEAPGLIRPIRPGASICVSGICLTVTAGDETCISFDVVPETLARSTLVAWRPGRRVNLEPSLRADQAMDGHIVQGHVDGTARVSNIRRDGGANVWTFMANEALTPFIIPKGSIALDGVSLTIAGVEGDSFSVTLIPTTLAVTTLGDLRVGDEVNVETDIVARTIVTTLARWHQARDGGRITMEMLREHGFA